MAVKEVFGKNLRYYRKLKRLSQEELSEKVDITAKHLSAIETGSSFVSAELLESLMRTLGVSASAFFYCSDEKYGGDTVFTLVDTVVTEELAKTGLAIRNRIRRAGNG
ncbi:MAG: helix-turn-helix transcriptional regulator [Treponematales bacterium]